MTAPSLTGAAEDIEAGSDDDAVVRPVVLSTPGCVALAFAIAAGCVVALPIALLPALVGVGVALLAGNRVGLILCAFLLATALGHRAQQGLERDLPSSLDETVLLVADPEPVGPGMRAEIRRDDGARLAVSAFGPAGWALASAEAGDYVEVAGSVTSLEPDSWLRWRHIAGRLSLTDATPTGRSARLWQPANTVRHVLDDGARMLPRQFQALYSGIIMGDDRFQTDGQRATFRAAGLTHLLAVSGQNVAFVLAVLSPVVQRLPRRGRVVLTAGAVAVFALATRLEPSVLRASTAAVMAGAATAGGYRRGGLRAVALTVSACCLCDPFLPRVLGFQLSVAASTGIVVGAEPLSRQFGFLGPLREAASVTIAAQLGVLPLLTAVFGPPSLVSIPANLAAGWAAGATMVWGLTVGAVAGVVGAWQPAVGEILQLPAAALCWWIDEVARVASRVPLASATPVVVGGLAVGAVAVKALGVPTEVEPPDDWWPLDDLPPPAVSRSKRWGQVAVVVLVAGLVVASPPRPSGPVEVGGAAWFPGAGEHRSVLVISGAVDYRLFDELVAAGIGRVDVVVTTTGDRRRSELIADLERIVDAEVILAPPQHDIPGAYRVTETVTIATATGDLVVTPDRSRSDRLEVARAGASSG